MYSTQRTCLCVCDSTASSKIGVICTLNIPLYKDNVADVNSISNVAFHTLLEWYAPFIDQICYCSSPICITVAETILKIH